MTTITVTIDTPLPTDTPAVFSAKAFQVWPDLNTLAGQINTVSSEVNANALSAAGSASLAGDHKDAANTSRLQAADSATNAAESATFAQDAAATVLVRDKLYLGPKTADPTLDNEGSPLLVGAKYYNSVVEKEKVYTGSVWVVGLSGVAGVESLNGLQGPVTLKTLNGQSFTGSGDVLVGLVSVSASSAVQNSQNLVDTRSAAVTLTLPASPSDRDSYQFFDAAGTFGTNNLTLARNGKSFKDIFGNIFSEDLVIDVSGVSVSVFYDGTYWRFQ